MTDFGFAMSDKRYTYLMNSMLSSIEFEQGNNKMETKAFHEPLLVFIVMQVIVLPLYEEKVSGF